MDPRVEVISQQYNLSYKNCFIGNTPAISTPANGMQLFFQVNNNLNNRAVKYIHAISPQIIERTNTNRRTAPLDGAVLTLVDGDEEIIQEVPLVVFDPLRNLNLFNQVISSIKNLNLVKSYVRILDATKYNNAGGEAFQIAFYTI